MEIALHLLKAGRKADLRAMLDPAGLGAAVFALPSVHSKKRWTPTMTASSRPRKSPMLPPRSKSSIRMATASSLRMNFAPRGAGLDGLRAVRMARAVLARGLTAAEAILPLATVKTVRHAVRPANEPPLKTIR